MYGATIHTSETIIINSIFNHFGGFKMLSISNYGSSRNCQSSQMHAYLKSLAMAQVVCNPLQPNIWYLQGVFNTLLYGKIK